MSSKKFINDAAKCVDDSTEGFLCLNHDVIAVKEHRLIIRNDLLDLQKNGQVAVLSGGGAGHEPAHMGYVGYGLLTAAISGNIFSSPPMASILFAIRAIGQKNAGGTLLIVTNYTGDRLNFGLAMNKARAEGMKVRMVIVNEDCALSSADKSAGRRGLCGSILIHKIAGAMSQRSCELKEIADFLEKTIKVMGTISASLSSCAIPGSSATFQIDDDHFELGLGIHGEPGVKRMKMMSARDVVKIMLDHMSNEDSANSFELTRGLTFVVVLNNLGGLSQLEMNIIVRECLDYLDCKGVNVARLYIGPLMTSLEMRGLSITLLPADSVILDLLDQKTSAPAWLKAYRPIPPSSGFVQRSAPMFNTADRANNTQNQGISLPPEMALVFVRAIQSACMALIANEQALNSLDSRGGDGDCGSTISLGARAIKEFVVSAKQEEIARPYHVFVTFSQIVDEVMGGTSGALFSIFFVAAASSFLDAGDAYNRSMWTGALKKGMKAVTEAGGAEPGDRTMVDALNAAVQALTSGDVDSSTPARTLATNVVHDVNEAVENTCNMIAKAGRASYVNQDNIRGHPDAGAMAILIVFKAIVSAL